MYFQYCPKCRAKLPRAQKRVLSCKYCDFLFYINVVPAAILILENSKGEILLTKRKFPPRIDYWDLPGGFIEFNESVEEGVRREIKEELGVKVKSFKYFGSYPGPYYYHGFTYQTLSTVFVGKISERRFKTGDDVKEAKFFPIDELPYSKIGFDCVKRALRDYKKCKVKK